MADQSNSQYSSAPFGLTGDYCSTGAPGSAPAMEPSEAAQSPSSRLGSAGGASGSYVQQVQAQHQGTDNTSPQDSQAGLTPATGFASDGPHPDGTAMAGHHPNSTARPA